MSRVRRLLLSSFCAVLCLTSVSLRGFSWPDSWYSKQTVGRGALATGLGITAICLGVDAYYKSKNNNEKRATQEDIDRLEIAIAQRRLELISAGVITANGSDSGDAQVAGYRVEIKALQASLNAMNGKSYIKDGEWWAILCAIGAALSVAPRSTSVISGLAGIIAVGNAINFRYAQADGKALFDLPEQMRRLKQEIDNLRAVTAASVSTTTPVGTSTSTTATDMAAKERQLQEIERLLAQVAERSSDARSVRDHSLILSAGVNSMLVLALVGWVWYLQRNQTDAMPAGGRNKGDRDKSGDGLGSTSSGGRDSGKRGGSSRRNVHDDGSARA